MGARVDLELLAMRALSYTVAPGSTTEEFDEADRAYLSDDYKRRVLEHMSINQLIDTILINPTVQLSPSRRDTGFTATYSFQPLSNLVYTRDQQVRFFFFSFFFFVFEEEEKTHSFFFGKKTQKTTKQQNRSRRARASSWAGCVPRRGSSRWT